jgi:hypothetical protein
LGWITHSIFLSLPLCVTIDALRCLLIKSVGINPVVYHINIWRKSWNQFNQRLPYPLLLPKLL